MLIAGFSWLPGAVSWPAWASMRVVTKMAYNARGYARGQGYYFAEKVNTVYEDDTRLAVRSSLFAVRYPSLVASVRAGLLVN